MSLPEIFYDLPAKRRKLSHHLMNFETVTYHWSHYTKEIVKPIATIAETVNAESDSDDADNVDIAPKQHLDATQFYERFVSRTPEQCYNEMKAPQRSAEWHNARSYCITASNFGAAVGRNRYCSPEELVHDKIWSSFQGNANTAYGTFHENDARESLLASLVGPLKQTLQVLYSEYFKVASTGHYVECIDEPAELESFELIDCGLLKHHEQPWMAVSPDGILILNGSRGLMSVLVEYKCPATKRDTVGHPYAKCVPEYYLDQMLGIMGLLNKFPSLISSALEDHSSKFGTTFDSFKVGPPKHALFVVWQPHQHHVTLVPYDFNEYSTRLEPNLKAWYFEKYLPLAVLKYNDALVPNSLLAAPVIEL